MAFLICLRAQSQKYLYFKMEKGLATLAGVDEGGGEGGAKIDSLTTQRVSLCTILRYTFLVTDPKNFLKQPSARIYTNFE